MTNIDIEQSFVASFEADVHVSYQRIGSKLKNTVRTRGNVKGATTTFQKISKGSASTKARNGEIPLMNISHDKVIVNLEDYYAGDWVDSLDELKMNHDEQQAIANAGAYALGRKTDELIINALSSVDTIEELDAINGDDIDSLRDKILKAFEILGKRDIPDDGNRFAIVSWKQWANLMKLPEFSNIEYVGSEHLPWKATQAKRWLGTLWMAHSGLPYDENSNVRECFWYHKNSVAHVSGQDIKTDITWHGDRASYFINNMMSQGAVAIDLSGIIKLNFTE